MISIDKNFNNPPETLSSNRPNMMEIKGVLYKLYHGKCAFSEEKLPIEELDIHHYRPKSKYPWLVFEWSNLLLVSKKINMSLSNRFETKYLDEKVKQPQDNACFRANSDFLLKENALLLHPEVDTPENYFSFDSDGYMSSKNEKGKYTIREADLNSDSLLKKRKQIVNKIQKLLIQDFDFIKLGPKNNSQKLDQLFGYLYSLINPESEFSLFGQDLFYNFWNHLGPILNDIEKKFAGQIKIKNNADARAIIVKQQENFIIRKNGINIEKNITRGYLPLAIQGFSIKDFQGIEFLKQDNIPLGSKWIFLTGENGFGKTSILRGILIGLIGSDEFSKKELSDNSRFSINLWEREKSINTISFTISTLPSSYHRVIDRIAAYGSIRTRIEKQSNYTNVSNSLFERENASLLNIESKLIELDGIKTLEITKNGIIDALKIVVPNLSKVDIEITKTGKKVIYSEKSSDSESNYRAVEFEELAAGMRALIALVGDIYLRLSKDSKIRELKDISGIVIIDEIDLHLHPNWLKKLPGLLSKIFPKVQFIASTHSPIPLLSAPQGSVFLKVSRSIEKGIWVERLSKLEKEIKQLTPNTIYTSDLFDLELFDDYSEEEFSNLSLENNYDEIEENRKITERLKQLDKNSLPNNLFKE